MRRGLFTVLCLLLVSCSVPSSRPATNYIPVDLEDAHRELARMLPPKELEHIKAMTTESETIEYHMNLGLGLRNQWGLWHDSRLARFFDRLGVHHPDDMSGIILETFWCKLHGQPFRLNERVRYCQAYWLSMEMPKDGNPKDGARIAWVISKGSGPGTIHLGVSTSDRSYWRYEYGSDRGIEPATEEDRKDLDELQETWKKLGTKIEDVLKY
ncbi:MAG TPA: DUF6794 domain-containing protein [Verrucomicrobiae bacterium]|nr:DUF6794 domain-containing protein [Verrucomicrobiae bacterium]